MVSIYFTHTSCASVRRNELESPHSTLGKIVEGAASVPSNSCRQGEGATTPRLTTRKRPSPGGMAPWELPTHIAASETRLLDTVRTSAHVMEITWTLGFTDSRSQTRSTADRPSTAGSGTGREGEGEQGAQPYPSQPLSTQPKPSQAKRRGWVVTTHFVKERLFYYPIQYAMGLIESGYYPFQNREIHRERESARSSLFDAACGAGWEPVGDIVQKGQHQQGEGGCRPRSPCILASSTFPSPSAGLPSAAS